MKSGVKHSEKKKMAQLSAGSDDARIKRRRHRDSL